MSDGYVVENGVANFEICARCGQAIKNVYWWHGKPYGSECINVVTGQKADYWIVKNGVIDEQATQEREIRTAEALEENKRKRDEIERERLWIKQANQWIIDFLSVQYGQFCADMAGLLTHTKGCDLSDRQFSLICDIYARSFGRRNSKAYNTAYDDCADRLDARVNTPNR